MVLKLRISTLVLIGLNANSQKILAIIFDAESVG